MQHCHFGNCMRQVNYLGALCSEHLPSRVGLRARATVWTRFTNKRTELQYNMQFGVSEPSAVRPGFATHHQMPIGMVELGVRAYVALDA